MTTWSRFSPFAALIAVAFAVGCAGDPPRRPLTEAELVAATRADSLDPWPHYDLARHYERRRNYKAAIHHYGMAINKVTPRTATGPMLSLGVLHHRLQHAEPAERCYREVLATVPSDTAYYVSNPDFRVAILSLAAILAGRDGAGEELERLRLRFLEDCGGTQAKWEAGPTWLTPLAPHEEPAKGP